MMNIHKVRQTEIEIDILYKEMSRIQAERAVLDIEYEKLTNGIAALKADISVMYEAEE